MKLDQNNPAAVTAAARRLGWLAADISVTRLSVAGEGNMNCVLRASLSDGASLIFKQSLPWVARYPQIQAPEERLDFEARFYQTIAADGMLARQMPGVVGYDADSRLLCLQDLGESSDLTSIYEAAPDAAELATLLPTVLGWLSRLHLLPTEPVAKSKFDNRAMRQLNHEHIYLIPLKADNGVALDSVLLQFAERLRDNNRVVQRIGQLGDIYLGLRDVDSTACLLHGDFYPGSWVRHGPSDVRVIDPEFCFLGAPEFDVGVLLAHLALAGIDSGETSGILAGYTRPPGFSADLARDFAAVEVIRRLLGVAQLPLKADIDRQLQWLNDACKILESE